MVRKDIHSAVEMEDDYEAQRQANIKANLDLMMSLGLYQGSTLLKPKSVPCTPKSKPKTKSVTPPREGEAREAEMQRPQRITRSVSRVLESPKKPVRGMKRALSDSFYDARKCPQAEEYDSESFISDEEDSPYRSSHLNQQRSYRPLSSLQRQSDRLGTRIHNPKTFGPIPGIPVGTRWSKRIDCSTDAVHAPTVAGISGNEHVGCWSICLSGGYEDDLDLGTTFTYTGSGGRDLKGTKAQPKNLRTAPQSSDQRWEGKNAALKKSVQTGKVVRVVRGYKGMNEYSPEEGYVYSGLYRVEKGWMERGAAGFMVCRFSFRRVDGQDPLPTFDHQLEEGVEEQTNELEEKDRDEELVDASPPTITTCSKHFIDLTHSLPPTPSPSPSPSPAPSRFQLRPTASPRSSNPILKSPGFNRAAYIIIDDSDHETEPEEEILMQLELPHLNMQERAVRSSRRFTRLRYTQ